LDIYSCQIVKNLQSLVNTYLVTIQDKDLYGEPDIALAIVEAPHEEAALLTATPAIEHLAKGGRCRCVPHARRLVLGTFYRLGALVSLPRNPSA